MNIGKRVWTIFASPLVLVKLVRKSKIDNFLGGLLIGALFSLVVNVLTVQIQGLVQKQRIFEALEHEILTNTLRASNILSEFNRAKSDEELVPNYFYTFTPYARDFWEQSSEIVQYTSQLDQATQIKIESFYVITLRYANAMQEKFKSLAENKLADCYFDFPTLHLNDQAQCIAWNNMLLEWEAKQAEDVNKHGYELLKHFHPTKDRLDNLLLRFFMGSDAMQVLRG